MFKKIKKRRLIKELIEDLNYEYWLMNITMGECLHYTEMYLDKNVKGDKTYILQEMHRASNEYATREKKVRDLLDKLENL